MANDLTLGLRIRVNDDGTVQVLNRTNQGLRDISTSAQQASRAVDESRRSFAQTALSALSVGDAVRATATGFTAVSIAASVKSLVNYADSMMLIDGRTKIATSSAADYVMANQALVDISLKTHTVLEANATLFARTNKSIEAMGGSVKNTLAVSDLLAKGLKISNAGVAEAASLTRQFSQSAASFIMRGDEFNSMMENGARVSQALADGLHVNIGALRTMAESGLLTMDKVLPALLSQMGKLNDEFKQLPVTVAGAFTNIETKFGQYIHSVNTAHGATKSLVWVVDSIADHLTPILDFMVMMGEAAVIALAIKGVDSLAKFSVAQYQSMAAQRQATAIDMAHTEALAMNAAARVEATRAAGADLIVSAEAVAANRASATALLAATNSKIAQARATILATEATVQSTSVQFIHRQATDQLAIAEQKRAAILAELALLGRQQTSITSALAATTATLNIENQAAAAATAAAASASVTFANSLKMLLNPMNALNAAFTGFMGYQFGSWLNEFSSVANYATERIGYFAKGIETSNYQLSVAKAIVTGAWGSIDELTAAHQRQLSAIDENTGSTIAWREALDKTNLSEKDYKDLLLSIKDPQTAFKEKANEITSAFNAGIFSLKDYTTMLGNLRSELDRVNATKLTDFDKEIAKIKDEQDKIKLSPADYQKKKTSEKFSNTDERERINAEYAALFALQDEQKRKEKELSDVKKASTSETKKALQEEENFWQKALGFLKGQAEQLNLLKLSGKEKALETEIGKNLNAVLGEAYDKTKAYSEAKQNLIDETINNTKQIFNETEAIARQQAMWDESVKQANALTDLRRSAEGEQSLANMAKTLTMMGATNDEVAKRVELERKLRAAVSANPDLDPQQVRDYVIAEQRAADEIAQYTNTKTTESAQWMEAAFKKAAENIQDSFASMFENMLNGDATASFAKFAENIKKTLNQAISQQLALDLQNLFTGKGGLGDMFKSALAFGIGMLVSAFSKESAAARTTYSPSEIGNSTVTGTGAMHIADSFSRDLGFEFQSRTIMQFNKNLDALASGLRTGIMAGIDQFGSQLASLSVVQSVSGFMKPITDVVSGVYNAASNLISSSLASIGKSIGIGAGSFAETVKSAWSAGIASMQSTTAGTAQAAESAAAKATSSMMQTAGQMLAVIGAIYTAFNYFTGLGDMIKRGNVVEIISSTGVMIGAVVAMFNPLIGGIIMAVSALVGLFNKVRTPNAWMNTYSEQGGNPYSFNPNASTYTATGNKSAYVGESTPFGMTVISTHEMSLSAQEMVNSFGELLKTVKTVDINLYNTINRLDQKFNETGKTMAYYNNVLASGARVATKQDASELNTGGMLAQRYSWIVDQLANSGSVVGQYLNAWFDVITNKFISVSQDNAMFVLGVIDSLASNLESFMAFPLALVDLIGNSVKSVSSGGTPDSVIAEITNVLNTFNMVSAGLKMLDMSADDNRIVTFLAHVNAIGFGVQEAGTNLLAYGIALQKINSEVMASGNQLLDTVEAKFNEMRNKGFDNTQMNAYFGSFGLFANLFAEAKVAFSAADLDVAAQHIHALSTASVEVAKNVINHTIATEQLTNISREAAIATLVKNGKLEEATVAEAEYGVSIQNTTKNVLNAMAFIQQWAYLSGQTLGEAGISAEVWRAAAANVVNVFGDMTNALKTFDDIAKTFLSPKDYAQYNLDTINRNISNMQATYPTLAGVTDSDITAAIKNGTAATNIINALAFGHGEWSEIAFDYIKLIAQRIDAEKSLNEALKASSESVTSARSALTAAYKNESSALTATITKFDSFSASLRKFRDELSIGNLSTANPMDKYRAAGDQFKALMTTINAGPGTTDASKAAYDQAQTDFQAKASAFLSTSRDVNASGSAYKTDYQRVLTAINNGIGSATSAKSAAELQLDRLNKSVSLLIEINDSVLSVTDAITALKSALLDNQVAAVVKAETINTAAQTAKKAPELRPDSVVSTAADYTDSMSNVITLSFAKDAKKNNRVSELQDQIDPLKEPIILAFAQKSLGKRETGAIADMTTQVSSIPNVISLSFAQKALGKKETGAIADMTAQVSSIPNVISLSFAQKALAKKEINVIAAMTAQVNSIPDVVTLSFAAAEKHNASIIEHLIEQVNSIPRVVPITLAYTSVYETVVPQFPTVNLPMGPMPLTEVMGPQLPTVNMPLFARGGISNQPSIFGEAGPEAAVPLPDGRSIPVTLKQPAGRSDNGDIVEQLKETLIEQQKQNIVLQNALLVLQAGFSQLVARSDQQQEILESVERQLRRNAA